ncbi:hypothetical protein C8R47DRAFT_224175 [Mycena vitilis]|nr:hypothetical protein C8R47DRAFT_224175 [Mycena vitilis]
MHSFHTGSIFSFWLVYVSALLQPNPTNRRCFGAPHMSCYEQRCSSLPEESAHVSKLMNSTRIARRVLKNKTDYFRLTDSTWASSESESSLARIVSDVTAGKMCALEHIAVLISRAESHTVCRKPMRRKCYGSCHSILFHLL